MHKDFAARKVEKKFGNENTLVSLELTLIAKFNGKGNFAQKNNGRSSQVSTNELGNQNIFKCHCCGKVGYKKNFWKNKLYLNHN